MALGKSSTSGINLWIPCHEIMKQWQDGVIYGKLHEDWYTPVLFTLVPSDPGKCLEKESGT